MLTLLEASGALIKPKLRVGWEKRSCEADASILTSVSEVCTGVDNSNNALTMMDLTHAPVTLVTKLLEVFVMTKMSVEHRNLSVHPMQHVSIHKGPIAVSVAAEQH